MTEQEALERCERLINGFSVNNSITEAFNDDEKGYPTFAKMKEFAEECKSALEKQIAKKPIWVERSFTKFRICPSCSNAEHYKMVWKQEKYCVDCGQKLDWGE